MGTTSTSISPKAVLAVTDALVTVTVFAALCIVALICSLIIQRQRRFRIQTFRFAPLLPSSSKWLLTVYYMGGVLMACHAVPYLTMSVINSQNYSKTFWTEHAECLTSILMFHIGYLFFFGPVLLTIYRLNLEACDVATIDLVFPYRIRQLRRKVYCVVFVVVLVFTVYLSLWLSLHPPSLPECDGSAYLIYLLIVENTFLVFGIFLTSGKTIRSYHYSHHWNLIGITIITFGVSIAVGITSFWMQMLVSTRLEKLMISTIESSLYILTVIVATQVIPIFHSLSNGTHDNLGLLSLCRYLCNVRSRRVRPSERWVKKTHFLSDERRLTFRPDIPSLPENLDAPLSIIYY